MRSTPARSRVICCHHEPRTRNVGTVTAAAAASAHQPIRRSRAGTSGETPQDRTAQASRQPRPYPVARLMPVASACRYQARGNSDGVMDQTKNSSASVSPAGWSDRAYSRIRTAAGEVGIVRPSGS